MKKSYDVATGIATFTFDGLPPLTFDTSKMSPENEQRMLGHGIEARLGDMAAIPRKQKDGSIITVTEAMRREAVEAGIAHYESGTTAWEMKGTPKAAPQNSLWAAIAVKRGVTYETVAAEYAQKAMAELAELGA